MIDLYTEHLLNIRALSVQASLSTVSNKETHATLSADGNILTITHEGETASITLPINLSPNRPSTVELTIPAVPSRELHFRVQLEAKDGVVNGVLTNGAPAEEGNLIPWTATSLGPDTEMHCRTCSAILLPRTQIGEWKDLPSEGWAEMMDFWHCHKPDEPHSHDHAHSKKGYAASSQLAIRPGVAMVGVLDFLLAPADCKNTEVLQDTCGTAESFARLLCKTCRSVVGQVDSTSQGYQLRKSRLSLSTSASLPSITHAMEKWFACLLLTAMETQGVRKFLIRDSFTAQALKAWIFIPSLSISSSMKSSNNHIRVCKILWQDVTTDASDGEKLNASVLSEAELQLREGELESLRDILAKSGTVLPEEARTFQEWQVGLLERFVPEDMS